MTFEPTSVFRFTTDLPNSLSVWKVWEKWGKNERSQKKVQVNKGFFTMSNIMGG
jgi:hypothetical protein